MYDTASPTFKTGLLTALVKARSALPIAVYAVAVLFAVIPSGWEAAVTFAVLVIKVPLVPAFTFAFKVNVCDSPLFKSKLLAVPQIPVPGA